MSQTGTITFNYTLAGLQFSSTEQRTAEGGIGHKITIPAGDGGTKASSTTITGLATGHALLAAAVFDMHWDDPTTGAHKVRQGITVDTSNANDIVFDETPIPTGDALPADATSVVCSVQVNIDTDLIGNLLEIAAVHCSKKSFVAIRDASSELHPQKLAAGASWFWMKDWGFTNPFAGDTIANALVSNGSTDAAVFELAFLYQSVS